MKILLTLPAPRTNRLLIVEFSVSMTIYYC